MSRHVQVTGLRPAERDEYLRLHRDVWPVVEQRLRDSGIRGYTIWLAGSILVGMFEYDGTDYDSDMAAIANDPVTRQWWALTDRCQEPLPEAAAGAIWTDAEAVWSLRP